MEEDNREDDLIPLGGGYPALFQKLYKNCKGNMLLNTRVVAIDMSGPIIILHTQNPLNPQQSQVFKAKKVISSLPLGILQR